MSPINPESTIRRLYKPLGNQQTRLLELLPGTGDDKIRVQLLSILVDKNETNKYEALSYTWTGDDVEILCNNVEFKTTANLRDALVHLRLPDQSRLIWADQICINQTDPNEKEIDQLPLLPDIYSGAQRVLIWLGKGDNVCVRGMKSLRQLIEDLTSSGDTGQEPVEKENYDLRAIYTLLTQRWFTRVWMLQEVAVARTALIIFGSETLEWHLLEFFNEMCQTDTTGRWTNMLSAISIADESTTAQILNSRFITAHVQLISGLKASLFSGTGRQPNLSDALLLTQVRTCQATFQNDKILSLFGFLSPELQAALVSFDNGKGLSTANFYHNVAKFELEECLNMNFLEASGLRQRSQLNSSMPSWVPDWTVVLFNHELWYLSYLKVGHDGNPLYQASKNKVAHIKVNGMTGELLEVRAKIVDTIKRTAEPFNWTIPRDHPDHGGQGLFQDMKAMIRLNQERYSSIKFRMDMAAFCKTHYAEAFDTACQQTFIAGIMQIGEGSTQGGRQRRATNDELHHLYASYFEAMQTLASGAVLESIERLEQGTAEGADFVNLMSLQTALPNAMSALKLLQHIQDACKRRIFFISDKGYMGLGPQGLEATKEGDKICVVHGCCVPFVIRPSNAEEANEPFYELIGEAYVHGLMDGEAMDMAHLGDEKLTFR